MMLKLDTYIPSGVAVGGIFAVIFMCCFISAGQADKKIEKIGGLIMEWRKKSKALLL